MAFSESIAQRTRHVLSRRQDIEEKKMFGGLAFLLDGKLLVGVRKDSLLVRLDPAQGEIAQREPYVRQFEIGGRALRGWVVAAAEAIEDDDQLRRWIQLATTFVATLSAKPKKVRKR
jgi:TfoX/Sxy family transcriptional regulator of competence genes